MTTTRPAIIFCLLALAVIASTIPANAPGNVPTAAAEENTHNTDDLSATAYKGDDQQFRYLSLGRPDPFRPFIDFAQLERPIPTENPASPLESYAINQFKLVGILLGPPNYAMIEDPEQISYTVREGDRLGNLSGTIVEIQENGLVVSEPYLDIYDRQQVRKVTLKLHSDDDLRGD
jgi:hypothetical protein